MRLHEKGGKRHEMPCHHTSMSTFMRMSTPRGSRVMIKSGSFRTTVGRSGALSERPMRQGDVYRMIGRRAAAAEVWTKIGCDSFRATGITEYLRNGGKLEGAQQMAIHESSRTTGLYDRRMDGFRSTRSSGSSSTPTQRCLTRHLLAVS